MAARRRAAKKAAGRKNEWYDWAIVVLGALVVLVAPGMPLWALLVAHPFQHWLLGLAIMLLGLWHWWSQK